jgi:hypothetical protein
MREVPLTNGGVALVDDEDYDKVMQHTWHWFRGRSEELYVKRWARPGLGHAILLHRFVLGLPPYRPQVDHINWNSLDNQKSNLRTVTQIENKQNARGAMSNNKTGVRGVCIDTKSKKYRAYCYIDKKQYHLGFFDTLPEAQKAAVTGRQQFMTHSQN